MLLCSCLCFAFPSAGRFVCFCIIQKPTGSPLDFLLCLVVLVFCLSHALPRFCHLDFKRCQTKSTNNDLCRRPPSRMDPWTCVFYCSTCRRILDCLKYDGFQKIMMMIPWICMSSASRCVTGLILYECCFMLHTLHIGFSPKDHLLLFLFWPWIPEASVPSPVQKVGYILSSTLKDCNDLFTGPFPVWTLGLMIYDDFSGKYNDEIGLGLCRWTDSGSFFSNRGLLKCFVSYKSLLFCFPIRSGYMALDTSPPMPWT